MRQAKSFGSKGGLASAALWACLVSQQGVRARSRLEDAAQTQHSLASFTMEL